MRAVDGLSLSLGHGEVVGIVGESGSGKTVSMMAVMRLIRDPNAIIEGQVLYRGRDLMALLAARDAGRPRRGDRDDLPGSDDGADAGLHGRLADRRAAARARADERAGRPARATVELLREVGIPNASRRADDYPHQFSGGMRQRVMIAMALSCNPSLLIADEPTTALDVTIQAQILELMKRLQRDHGSSIVLITHDMGVVADLAERVVVMYAGSVVEEGSRSEVFRDPQHPYTWGLLGSMPARRPARGRAGSPRSRARRRRCSRRPRAAGSRRAACTASSAARRGRRSRRGSRRAARTRAISTRRSARRSAGVAGRPHGARERVSGAGPARGGRPRQALPGALGSCVRGGREHRARRRRRLARGAARRDARRRRRVGLRQVDPRPAARPAARADERHGPVRRDGHHDALAVGAAAVPARDADDLPGPVRVAEPAQARRADRRRPVPHPPHGRARRRSAKRVQELLEVVGLSPDHVNRYPHEFSGGQRQRIGVARALALSPQLIVADEPVSALDVSIQAQVVNLLDDLQDEFGLTYVFIAHDLGVVHHVSDRIAVMYLGVVVEIGAGGRRSTRARCTRTPRRCCRRSRRSNGRRASRAARERIVLEGEVPSPIDPPTGCRFHPRCRYATEICRVERPPLADHGGGRFAACHHPLGDAKGAGTMSAKER